MQDARARRDARLRRRSQFGCRIRHARVLVAPTPAIQRRLDDDRRACAHCSLFPVTCSLPRASIGSMPAPDVFGLTPQTAIRDSLSYRIPLCREAAALLAAPAFLRLDRIQQLGFVSRVWPGAKHTRFEHSLGVMHLMRAALERLWALGAPFSEETARTA